MVFITWFLVGQNLYFSMGCFGGSWYIYIAYFDYLDTPVPVFCDPHASATNFQSKSHASSRGYQVPPGRMVVLILSISLRVTIVASIKVYHPGQHYIITTLALVFQILAQKFFWAGFWGSNISSQGVWKPMATYLGFLMFP